MMDASQDLFVDVVLPLESAYGEQARRQAVAEKLGVPVDRVKDLRLRKESIDSRQKTIRIQMRFEVGLDASLPDVQVPEARYPAISASSPSVVIVGSGPAGMFAALRCLELGMKPIVLERGKEVTARQRDLAEMLASGVVNEESNYCFGEGGAGTFSDGKLYTRATKRGSVRAVYEVFVAHGAPIEILTDAHPHIGSNRLPAVVKAMRKSVLRAGGEVHFSARVAGLLMEDGGRKIAGVRTDDGREFISSRVILATGHSARDVYRMLADASVELQRKPFAVGVRIEHPQQLIDEGQYHLKHGQPRPSLLPAAKYSLATTIDRRGVHSFCMCPGGYIVPAATAKDEVVVNGMSLAERDSPFANSGFVVTVTPEDTDVFSAEHGVLSGLAYQKELEVCASQAGGGRQKAPAQLVVDFMYGKESPSLLETTYAPGLTSCSLHELLPKGIVSRMRTGLQMFEKKIRGFTGRSAQLIGVETRTSSPVRVPRLPDTLEHPGLEGLYPCGEGAGYAGGIVSAAMDGRRCAEAVGASLGLHC